MDSISKTTLFQHYKPAFKPISLGGTLLAAVIATFASASHSQTVDQNRLSTPLPSANRNPLAIVYSPPQASGAMLTPAHTRQWAFGVEMASHSSQNLSASESVAYQSAAAPLGESIILDGETIRSELSYRFGLSEQSDIGISLPHIAHTSGFADSGIETWHDWFGLPNGNRQLRPRNGLLYSYQINGEEQLGFNRDQQGLGDIQVDYRYAFKPQTPNNTDRSSVQHLLQFSLKLATGDKHRLSGSGANTAAISFNSSQASMAAIKQLSWHASAGAMWLDNGGVLEPIKNDWVYFGSAGIGWQLNKRLALKLQFNGHSAIYDSDTKELGKTSGQVVLGLNAISGKQSMVQLYFTEDIIVRTSPDIGIGLSIRRFTQ